MKLKYVFRVEKYDIMQRITNKMPDRKKQKTKNGYPHIQKFTRT